MISASGWLFKENLVNFTRRWMSPQLPPYGRFGTPSRSTCWGSKSGHPAHYQRMYLKDTGVPSNDATVTHVMTGVHNNNNNNNNNNNKQYTQTEKLQQIGQI